MILASRGKGERNSPDSLSRPRGNEEDRIRKAVEIRHYRAPINSAFHRVTPGSLLMTCVKDGGKPRWNADNQPYSVDSVWTAKKARKDAAQVLRCPVPRK